ncbi:MAG TPA: hypothetical protein VGR21_06255 [Cryptosporangiaceae bacterium]|nr:hypothetical protein [Cryptosporangiaceae bacterium]
MRGPARWRRIPVARTLRATGDLPELARAELTAREAGWRYDGVAPPRHRRRWMRLRRRTRDGF